MKSIFIKLFYGLKTDPLGTLLRASIYLFKVVMQIIATLYYYLLRLAISIAPVFTLAKLKQKLNPAVQLDYPKRRILLYADSEISIFRARACQKEPETVNWIENQIKPGEVLYDVGANVGAYSLVAASFFDKNITVHAFEPSFSTYYQLARNIVLNQFEGCVYPHLMALADTLGTVVFHYRSLDGGSADHVMDGNTDFDPQKAGLPYHQQLICYGIDDLVSKYDFPVPNHIKVDVDGAENLVLLGASQTLLNKSIKSILVEVRSTDEQWVRDYLGSKGFEVLSRHDRGGGTIWNYIFVRK
ncbi:MAG TPA: FkbM family methyltransferase [Anaerolineales bacterium]|nr:FkbM family methyltransferase [Anaerolineales bacterium]